jgi:cell wall assembly regulator SMI1
MAGKSQKNRMKLLLQELEASLAQIDRSEGRSGRSKPYRPSSEADIAAAERRLKVRLPPSYVEFLRLHNGWDGFNSGDISVLGVSGPGYKKAHAQWKADLAMFEKSFRRRGQAYAEELREKSKQDADVIYVPEHTPFATNYNGDWWVFDQNRGSSKGEYGIARVAHGQDVESRWQSFQEFVEDNVRRVQGKLRKITDK